MGNWLSVSGLFNRKPRKAPMAESFGKSPEMAIHCQLLIGSCGGSNECRCTRPSECEFTAAERAELERHPEVVAARKTNTNWREQQEQE